MRIALAIFIVTRIAGPALWGQSPIAKPLAQTTPAIPGQRSGPAQSSGATGASSGKRLTFDVASVKVVKPPNGVTVSDGKYMIGRGASPSLQIPRNTGGPGSSDPGRIHYPLITLKELLRRGWNSYFEIESPDWLDSQTVAIDATMPRDTTGDQFREMLRNLITDRFGLKYHTEARGGTNYILVVAKNGPKMKESADQTEGVLGPPPSEDAPPLVMTPYGFPIEPPRAGSWCMGVAGPGGRRERVCQQKTMKEFAEDLRGGKMNVTDATGLTARYDFTLAFSVGTEPSSALGSSVPQGTPEAADLPDIFGALQSQLGLRLEPSKTPMEVMVVDHIEKTPTRN